MSYSQEVKFDQQTHSKCIVADSKGRCIRSVEHGSVHAMLLKLN